MKDAGKKELIHTWRLSSSIPMFSLSTLSLAPSRDMVWSRKLGKPQQASSEIVECHRKLLLAKKTQNRASWQRQDCRSAFQRCTTRCRMSLGPCVQWFMFPAHSDNVVVQRVANDDGSDKCFRLPSEILHRATSYEFSAHCKLSFARRKFVCANQ